jgi:hypothetical protein
MLAAMKYFALVLFIAACGSKAAPTSTTTETTATPVLPDVPFDQLDHDQKIEFMKQRVMPAMEPVFKKHDEKEFAEFGCKTCHGEQAAQGHFHMPNAGIPKLTFKDMSKFKPEDIEWMKNEVKPAMAKLLGEPEFTPENPTGFGCQSCHETE